MHADYMPMDWVFLAYRAIADPRPVSVNRWFDAKLANVGHECLAKVRCRIHRVSDTLFRVGIVRNRVRPLDGMMFRADCDAINEESPNFQLSQHRELWKL